MKTIPLPSAETKNDIPKTFSLIDEKINLLEKQMDELYQKLEPVLEPPRPTECTKEGAERKICSPLTASLEELYLRLNRLSISFRDIFERLEL